MDASKQVQNYIQDTIFKTKSSGNTNYFSTYECKQNDNFWIQFTASVINLSYPFTQEPISKLNSLGVSELEGLEILDWENETFLMLEYDIENIEQVSNFIVSYFKEVFNIEISEKTFNLIPYS